MNAKYVRNPGKWAKDINAKVIIIIIIIIIILIIIIIKPNQKI